MFWWYPFTVKQYIYIFFFFFFLKARIPAGGNALKVDIVGVQELTLQEYRSRNKIIYGWTGDHWQRFAVVEFLKPKWNVYVFDETKLD